MLLRRNCFLVVFLLAILLFRPARAEIAATLQIPVDKPDRAVGTRLYGANIEHMFNAVQGGLWGELLQNRKMMPTKGRGDDPPAPWFSFSDAEGSVRIDAPRQSVDEDDLARSLRLEAPEGSRAGVAQGDIALRPGDTARLSVWLRGEGSARLTVSLGDAGASVSETLPLPAGGWRRVVTLLTLPRGARDVRLTLAVTGPGVAFVYAPSLMTEAAYAADGFEPAVLARARTLSPQFLRYPGGNFAQNYRWRDGVGPRDERPVRVNVWGGLPEPNDMGTDEFLALCRRLKAEPTLVVNVGGRGATPQDAADWVAYCNGGTDTPMGRLRAANGRTEPYNVRIWEIGNEVYGDWVTGHLDADAYARAFDSYVRAMRAVDPTIKVVAVGQAPEWNRQVLAGAQIVPDFLSLHLFVAQSTPADVLAQPVAFELFLRRALDTAKTVGKAPRLAVNEWALNMKDANATWLGGLFAASLIHALQRVPEVGMAAVNGLINGWEGGVIQRDGLRLYATPTQTVLSLYRRHTGTQGLPVHLRAGLIPVATSAEVAVAYPLVDVVASKNPRGPVFVCVINKSPSEGALLSISLPGLSAKKAAADLWTLQAGLSARNDFDAPERLQPNRRRVSVQNARFAFRFAPLSVTWISIASG